MTGVIHLSPADILAERPFTHPDFALVELKILRYMVDRLGLALESFPPGERVPYLIKLSEADGRPHRLAINQPEKLRQGPHLAVVGFFGQRRNSDLAALIDQLDKILVAELSQHLGLLSYCTLLLENGDFGNLVLFEDAVAQSHWSAGQTHARAVQLSPGYYHSVRIYNGELPGGFKAGQTLYLTQARYYDYQSDSPWQGVRGIK